MIEWCDPPARSDGKVPWTERLAPLIDRPGVWAKMQDYATLARASDCAIGLRSPNRRPMAPPGRWEFVARQIDPDCAPAAVWARYLGE